MNPLKLIPTIFFALLTLASCEPTRPKITPPKTKMKTDINDKDGLPAGHKLITLGGGCYWCVEAVFQQLEGVYSVTSGFMGGTVANPSYEDVCTKTTGHIEVIQVVYNPAKLPLGDLLAWFWSSHDPTTKDRQGVDVGPQYASAIFYHYDEDKATIDASVANAQKVLQKPIVTQIRKAETFYKAPASHQDFYFQNQGQRYCRSVIKPKLEKLKLKN